MKIVYLDNNATTQVAKEVLESMLPYFSEYYGNPSSMHSFGGQVAQKIRVAREQVAALIGASPDEIILPVAVRKVIMRLSVRLWRYARIKNTLSPAGWNIRPYGHCVPIWLRRGIE